MLAEQWFEERVQATAEAAAERERERWATPDGRDLPVTGARCNDGTGDLVALFFSEQLDDIARAKAICSECPLREPCFDRALARGEPYGVWGGHLFFKGKVLAFKRPRGRPPKDPRPLSA